MFSPHMLDPPKYARDSIPEIKLYPDGQTTPTPSAVDFNPGDLLGCVSGELGLRKYLEGWCNRILPRLDSQRPIYVLLISKIVFTWRKKGVLDFPILSVREKRTRKYCCANVNFRSVTFAATSNPWSCFMVEIRRYCTIYTEACSLSSQ